MVKPGCSKEAKAALSSFLLGKNCGEPSDGGLEFDAPTLRRLIERIDRAPLFAHSYAFHLNLRFGTTTPSDVLGFAGQHGLAGLKIHVEDGEARSLLHMDHVVRARFGRLALQRGLQIHIETSSTASHDLETAVAIARDVGATSIRCYPRYEGRVSEIIRKTIEDLQRLRILDPAGQFLFTLEQHEDLKSHELVQIVRAVGNPRLSLLFDFGNMTNAYESPETALVAMAPLVTEVHVKDVRILEDRGGWAHQACRSGEGDINFPLLLTMLLLLGDDVPQVTAIGLEEEVGMYAPAYRFPDETDDPFIPTRDASTTLLPEGEALQDRLERERSDAARQVGYVRMILGGLRARAAALHEALTADQPASPAKPNEAYSS